MPEIPQPLWPVPDWEKMTIRHCTKPERGYMVWMPDVTGGGWYPVIYYSLGDAMDFVTQEYCAAARGTEYVERREMLARFLCDLVYGTGYWVEAESDVILNYRLDADDIIKANPHLLSLEERERLQHIIPELAYGQEQN